MVGAVAHSRLTPRCRPAWSDGGDRSGTASKPEPMQMEVHVEGQSTRRTTIDDQGWFSYAPVPHTPFRLLWRVTISGTAMTEWLSL